MHGHTAECLTWKTDLKHSHAKHAWIEKHYINCITSPDLLSLDLLESWSLDISVGHFAFFVFLPMYVINIYEKSHNWYTAEGGVHPVINL